MRDIWIFAVHCAGSDGVLNSRWDMGRRSGHVRWTVDKGGFSPHMLCL